jgi:hypothetical protein
MRSIIYITLMLSLLYVSSCTTHANLNPELYPASIPSNVKYSPPSESKSLEAKQLLEKALQNTTSTPVGLFGGVVGICPKLWSEIKSKEPYKSDPGARTFVSVDGVIQEGKAFKIKESMDALELYLRDKLNSDGPVTIRPPNHEDLRKYWAVIAWDIETPIFVAGNNKINIIFDYDHKDGHFWNVVLLK